LQRIICTGTANAIGDYTKGQELKPQDAVGYYSRGVSKLKLDDFTGCIAYFTSAIAIYPDTRSLILSGVYLKCFWERKKQDAWI